MSEFSSTNRKRGTCRPHKIRWNDDVLLWDAINKQMSKGGRVSEREGYMGRKRGIARRPIKSVAPGDHVRYRSTAVLTRGHDKAKRREGNCWKWTREERVGNERVLVDQSWAWHLQTTWNVPEGPHPAMGRD